MRKNFLAHRLKTMLIATMLHGFLSVINPLHAGNAFDLWKEGKIPASDIVDTSGSIGGDYSLTGPLHIKAKTRDVTIRVDKDTAIAGGRYESVETALYLSADAGRKIVFELEKDLTFQSNGQYFLVVFSGKGDLEFKIKGGQKLRFDQSESGPGTYFLVGMGTDDVIPTVLFTRLQTDFQTTAAQLPAEIIIGGQSLISFAGTKAGSSAEHAERGLIAFNPSNKGSGRLVLRVKDSGAFIIRGHKIANLEKPMINDLDLEVPVGGAVEVTVLNDNENAQASAGLLIINENNHLFNLKSDPFGNRLDDIRYGFVLGTNGLLSLGDGTYADYVGTRLNQRPHSKELTKLRNPSAFMIDVPADQAARPARIKCEGNAALYFRSAVDNTGHVQEKVVNDNGQEEFFFAVDPEKRTSGIGNVVLDVEGPVTFEGIQNTPSALNILSLFVEPTGGTTNIGTGKTLFPKRSFERDSRGRPLGYNNACVLINDRLTLKNTVLRHDDVNHKVFSKNREQSEPTYIGGEKLEGARPSIALINATIDFHESAALAGVDIVVPNGGITGQVQANESRLVFYSNGRAIDKGTGRNLILGSRIDGTACGCNLLGECPHGINIDAHLDVRQECAQSVVTPHKLMLVTGMNDKSINSKITNNPGKQSSTHTIYTAHGSNISLGTNNAKGTDAQGKKFPLTTQAELIIDGETFSMETQGGPTNTPKLSGDTGKGAIFADKMSRFAANKRANLSTMVVRNFNAIIELPTELVIFDEELGITQWRMKVGAVANAVIIEKEERLSNYNIDWMGADHVITQTAFTPYEPVPLAGFMPYDSDASRPCTIAPVKPENVLGIPEILGEVDQLQIMRSRVGDQAHVRINGGFVRELIFLRGYDSAEEPVGVVVLENLGRVGLGSSHRDADSNRASSILGINGVTIIPDGDGVVEMNSNLVINSYCHIAAGPNFGKDGEQRLTFRSAVMRELRVKSSGILDLSSFSENNQVLQFAGKARLVLEPGARVVMGPKGTKGGVLLMNEESQILLESELNTLAKSPLTMADSDAWRVRFSGNGRITLKNKASISVPANTLMGIETFPVCSPETDLTLRIEDSAKFAIGSDTALGGAFQIGNTQKAKKSSQKIRFTLELDGLNALVEIGRQGFFGTGAGVAEKLSAKPNEWEVGSLYDVDQVNFALSRGTFKHSQIDDGDSANASLFAIGPSRNYSHSLASAIPTPALEHLGGANIIRIPADCQTVNPTVFDKDGAVEVQSCIEGTPVNVHVGVLASKPLIYDGNKDRVKEQLIASGSSEAFYNLLKTDNINPVAKPRDVMHSPKANIASRGTRGAFIDFVDGTKIVRQRALYIATGVTAEHVAAETCYTTGSVDIIYSPTLKTVTSLIKTNE